MHGKAGYKVNMRILPQIYYGLHMCEGVAEYREKDKSFRVLILENAIKSMDATFPGRPLYVHHVDEVDLENITAEADGYVVESFFNKADGKHWSKFIVVTDQGLEAIKKGWKLSNAYHIRDKGEGGRWHGVDYQFEVTRGEYEHLAIVPNPRYGESIILTPEQFKTYNANKEAELLKLANSKDKEPKGVLSMFKFFKKEKVENSADLENIVVELPKSKKSDTIANLLNSYDGMLMEEREVDVGGEKMSVNALINKYNAMKAKNEEDEKKKKEDEDKAKNEAEEKKKKEEEEKKNKNSADDLAKKTEQENFDKLKNAPENGGVGKQERVGETANAQIARGQSRYGSGK